MKQALEQALLARPEITQSGLNLDINTLDVRFYKNQTKPQVNAYTTVTASGLAGTPQTVPIFGNFPSGTVPDNLIGANWQSLQ